MTDAPAASSGRWSWGPWAAFALALLAYWPGLGQVSLFDRDEPRYVGTALRMAETGDWIVPYFNGRFRFQKPPLAYWLIAAATWAFGTDEFGMRAMSGLCVAAAAALVWRTGDRMFGAPAGALAGTMFALAPMSGFLGKLALPDAPLLLCSAACLAALHAAWRPQGDLPGASRWPARWFWSALALSMLAKGPILPGIVAMFFAVFWLTARQSPARFALAWRTGPWACLALAAPWFAAAGYATNGGFFREAVGRQVVDRFAESFDGRFLPPGYYVATAALMFSPWMGYALLTLFRGGRAWKAAGPTGFLAAWCLGSLALLEAFRSKQPHYWAPAYPALALLAAGHLAGLWRGAARQAGDWLDRGTAVWHAGLGLMWAGGFAYAARVLPAAAAGWLWLAAALALASGLAAATLWLRRAPRWAFLAQAGAQLGILWSVGLGALPGWETERLAKPLARAVAAADDLPFASFEDPEPSLSLYAGRPVPRLFEHPLRMPAAGLPLRALATQSQLAALRSMGGDWTIERTFVGWHRMHRDTLLLVVRRGTGLAGRTDAPPR